MDWLGVLFPRNCLECKKDGKYLCASCLSKVELANPVCPACKAFSREGATHNSCKPKTSLDGALAIWRYQGVIRKAVLRLKYNFVIDLAKELCMVSSVNLNRDSHLLQNSVFIPIPLHKNRENWRGFNQAKIIAMGLGKILEVPVDNNLILRTKAGVNQAQLDRASRLRNMSGKYAVINSHKALVKWGNTKIILVDDVWTTGSTLNEAGKVLKEAGFKEVWGLTVAR